MPDFITLTCPSCGGKLQITNDMQRFACAYCGTEHIVNRSEGVISLSPVVEGLKNVQVAVDKTASELAINRLKGDIAKLEVEINRIRNEKTPNTRGILTGMIFTLVGLIILLSAIAASSSSQQGCGGAFFLGGFLIVAGILLIVLTNRAIRQAEKKRKAKLTPFMDTWRQKQDELKYHEGIVSR